MLAASTEAIGEWFASEPVTGSIYQLAPNETLLGVASKALHHRLPRGSLRLSRTQVIAYAHAISSGRMARQTYGSPSFSRKFPAELLVPGTGQGIHAAFWPINESVRAALEAGRLPRRAIDERGRPLPERVGKSLGALFLPPICAEALRRGRVEIATWPGGWIALDLPPRVFEQFRTAA